MSFFDFDSIDYQNNTPNIVQKIAKRKLGDQLYPENVTDCKFFDIYYLVERTMLKDIFAEMKRWNKKSPIIKRLVDAYSDRFQIESLPHVALVFRHPVYEHVIIHTHQDAPKTKVGIWYQCDSSLPFKTIYIEPLKDFIAAYGDAYATSEG